MKIKLTLREHKALAKSIQKLSEEFADVNRVLWSAVGNNSRIMARSRAAQRAIDRMRSLLDEKLAADYPDELLEGLYLPPQEMHSEPNKAGIAAPPQASPQQ